MGSKVYDSDVVMRNLWLHLLRDFRETLGHGYSQNSEKIFREGGIKELRAYKWPARSQVSPYLFKTDYQLENLFKRYRFGDDLFSEEALSSEAYAKFSQTQERIATPFKRSPLVDLWLKKARIICKDILGRYDREEHFSSCRFGKRACIGTSYRDSYLDVKLGKPLTGSYEHTLWFEEYLKTDPLLLELLQHREASQTNGKLSKRYKVCKTLKLALVPKSYKAKRTILANTLIGSFATYGLGKVFQARLLEMGLDIRRLQHRHGQLAKASSRSRKNATADLSSASDSISRELLRMILPAAWYREVLRGSLAYVKYEGSIHRMSSVITMGMGHTFPLQTLIFYCLIKAIGELKGEHSTFVSVYGDDLIYPRRLHRFVRVLFPLVHLNLNGDKTYVEDFFRESCGSDYYRGVDVRPFQPEGERELLSGQHFAVFIYKLINGLAKRWDKVEIPCALNYLFSELILTQGQIFQVPTHFPDGAGYKCSYTSEDYFVVPPMGDKDIFGLKFKYLSSMPLKRIVSNQYPYYWEKLRVSHNSLREKSETWDCITDLPELHWFKAPKGLQPKNYRSSLTGKRLRKLVPAVSSKTNSRLSCQTGSVSNWT